MSFLDCGSGSEAGHVWSPPRRRSRPRQWVLGVRHDFGGRTSRSKRTRPRAPSPKTAAACSSSSPRGPRRPRGVDPHDVRAAVQDARDSALGAARRNACRSCLHPCPLQPREVPPRAPLDVVPRVAAETRELRSSSVISAPQRRRAPSHATREKRRRSPSPCRHPGRTRTRSSRCRRAPAARPLPASA
jgi:hypothetical protein